MDRAGHGQVALDLPLVDGRLVTAPRVEGTAPDKGIVKELDEAAARRLADRLNR